MQSTSSTRDSRVQLPAYLCNVLYEALAVSARSLWMTYGTTRNSKDWDEMMGKWLCRCGIVSISFSDCVHATV